MKNEKIKSMKLYNFIDRVYNELKELGKNSSESLLVEELTNFDQLHYYGTAAVDSSISKIGIPEPFSKKIVLTNCNQQKKCCWLKFVNIDCLH